jgi:hypothetical protein
VDRQTALRYRGTHLKTCRGNSAMSLKPQRAAISIRPMAERDIPDARRIVWLAFGTFLGAPDPATFWEDRIKFCIKLGVFRLLRAFDSSSRSLESGRRSETARPDGGNIPQLGCSPQWAVHLCAERKACEPVSKVWFLATLPDRDHDEALRVKAISWSEFSRLDQDGPNRRLLPVANSQVPYLNASISAVKFRQFTG